MFNYPAEISSIYTMYTVQCTVQLSDLHSYGFKKLYCKCTVKWKTVLYTKYDKILKSCTNILNKKSEYVHFYEAR